MRMSNENEPNQQGPIRGITNSKSPAPITARNLLIQHVNTPSPLYLLHPFTWLRLNNGLLSQLAGAGGSGKSQIALHTCMDVVSRTNQRALYVALGTSNCGKYAQRLAQMAAARGRRSEEEEDSALLNRIVMIPIVNVDDFVNFVDHQLPELLASAAEQNSSRHEEEPFGIIVLDSIANLFRGSDDENSFIERSSILFYIAGRCKALSDRYQVPVLVLNQVTASLSAGRTIPALGLSWAQCVNQSFMIERSGDTRRLVLERSSQFGRQETSFVIRDFGVAVQDDGTTEVTE